MNTDKIKVWAEQLQKFSFPRYNELPYIELYMDQVTGLLNQFLAPLYDDMTPITASMINNYVKLQLLPAPNKKRYTRTHLAHLIVIIVTKQILPINDATLLLHLTQGKSEEEVYNDFCTVQEEALHNMAKRAIAYTTPSNETAQTALQAVVCATADKMLSQKLLNLYHPAQEQSEKEAKKDAKKKKGAEKE